MSLKRLFHTVLHHYERENGESQRSNITFMALNRGRGATPRQNKIYMIYKVQISQNISYDPNELSIKN